MSNSKNTAAVRTAKRRRGRKKQSGVLSTGIKARLLPVSISVINEAQAAVPNPEVPQWHNEAKDTWEDNPNHPDYIRALAQVETDRNVAAIDAMVLFGVELTDGMPEDDYWLRKLRLAIRRNLLQLDLSEYDLEDELDREFVFKKYVAVAAPDTRELMEASGINEEDIAEASRSFPDNEERGADRTPPAE